MSRSVDFQEYGYSFTPPTPVKMTPLEKLAMVRENKRIRDEKKDKELVRQRRRKEKQMSRDVLVDSIANLFGE